MAAKSRFLSGNVIDPKPVKKNVGIVELVGTYFHAYSAARLRKTCQIFTQKLLAQNVTVGMSLTGALTPAGLGGSCVEKGVF